MSCARTLLAAAALAASASVASVNAGGIIIGEPPISFPIAGCGELVFDEVCETLFRMENGAHFSFPGMDKFAVGDQLYIAGDVCLICLLTECGSPYAAIMNVTVLECDATGEKGEAIPFDGCVQVVVDPDCGPLLQAADGTLYYGEPFVTSEQDGLSFHAVGAISSQFTVLCGGSPVPDMLPFFVELTLAGCSGDVNGDGTVGGADLAMLLAAWGEACESAGACFADLDGDGDVDGADLAELLAAWGS